MPVLLRVHGSWPATRARTSIRDDVILCILEDNLTKAERTLVNAGRAQLVLETRRAFRDTMRDELVMRVEESPTVGPSPS